jgi:hypothetical protein
MEMHLRNQMGNAAETVSGVFERDAANDPVHVVSLGEKELGQIGAVLAGDAGDQCDFFRWHSCVSMVTLHESVFGDKGRSEGKN